MRCQKFLAYGAFREDRMPGLPLKNCKGKTCFVNAFVQEDAHDFIRQWLDTAQQHLKGCVKQAQRTPLEYIFSWVLEDQMSARGLTTRPCAMRRTWTFACPSSRGSDQQGRPQVVASVQEALSLFTTREVMDGGDKFSCPCCSSKNGKQVAHKRLCIYTIPNTLVLPLKRFWKDPFVSQEPIKLYSRIQYGQKLDLKEFLAPSSPDHPAHHNNTPKPNIAELRLSGVLIHQGGIGEGHYWAYVQDRYGRWWKFDDHRQTQVGIEEVVSHPDAYILLYVRNQPRVMVVDAPKGCEVCGGPQSVPGVEAEEPKTNSGASVKEMAKRLIAAGNAAPISGSRSHAQVQEVAPEGGGAQAAQVGVVSASRSPPPSGPTFDMDGWLSNDGLVLNRSRRLH
ncbi:hypothetical protein WJX77_012415 [Trebouxia sp. C0004]